MYRKTKKIYLKLFTSGALEFWVGDRGGNGGNVLFFYI